MKNKYLALVLLRIFPIIAQLGLLTVLLKTAGASEAGKVAFFIAGSAAFRGLAPFGLDLEVLRVSSRSLSEAGALSRGLFQVVLKRGLVTSCVSSLILLMASSFLQSSIVSLAWIALAGFFGSLVGVLVSFLRPSPAVILSQAMDAIGTSLIPTLVVSILALSVGTSFNYIVSCFALCSFLTLLALGVLAFRLSDNATPFEKIDLRAMTSSGIAQALLASNSRFPTLATGLLYSPSFVTYVDLGSKLQLLSGTVAWIFGIIQSPDYARDGKELSVRSLRGILRSTIWSIALVICTGVTLLLICSPMSAVLNLDQSLIANAIIVFLFLTIIEAPAISLGYGLVMIKKSNVVAIAVFFQMVVSLLGLNLSEGNLIMVGVSLCLGAIVRLATILILSRGKH